MKRNKEFDRPYWDVASDTDRYKTTSRLQQEEVAGSLFGHTSAHEKRLPTHDIPRNICRLFSYPSLAQIQSTSQAQHSYDSNAFMALNPTDTGFRLKRNEYSEYTERRIRFGLKF